MTSTRVVFIETGLARTESESGGIREVLGLVEVARLVEDRMRNILRVLLQRGETTRFTESKLLF